MNEQIAGRTLENEDHGPQLATEPVLRSLSGRRRLGEETEQVIRDAIMSGGYAAGDRLKIDDLARRLDVSTMPVREALVSLMNEGLVESLQRRGFRVAPFRLQDVEDVYEVHAYIAGQLAERACHRITGEVVDALQQIQAEIERVARLRSSTRTRVERVEELNYQFHRRINTSVDAPRLRWFLRTATRYVPRSLYETLPGWVDISVDDHPEIIDALASVDPQRAGALVHQHVLHGGAMLIESMKRHAGETTGDSSHVNPTAP